jgi:hypothetical protein
LIARGNFSYFRGIIPFLRAFNTYWHVLFFARDYFQILILIL